MTVITFGELLLRLSPPGEERLLESPVLHTCFGGAEANVAVALRHLGVPSSYITRLPESPLGEAGVGALLREGVTVDRVLRGGSRLGLYFVEPGADLRDMRVVYDRASSAFSQITPADVDWSAALAGARWLHGTGITPALGNGPATALSDGFAAARQRGVTVSLDLNYREALWRGPPRDPRPLIEPLARQANVLIGNRDAVRAMLGVEANAEELANRYGCRAVAITQREILGPREHGWSAVLYDSATRAVVRSHRHGVQGVVSALYDVPVGETWRRDRLAHLQDDIADAGLRLAVVESIPVHEDIKLGRPTRDRLIANYCESIRAMGELGVRVLCYNFMPVFDWMRTDLAMQLPDGSTALAYDDAALARMDLARGTGDLPGWAAAYDADALRGLLAAYREVDAERLWDSLAYFLERVVPVAEQAGVRMAIPPDDPPWPILGLPRIIFRR